MCFLLIFKRDLVTEYLLFTFNWAKQNKILCIFTYICIGIPWVTICLPGSLLTLCAGVIFTEAFGLFGIIVAWLIGIFNHFIAGQISWYIARYLLYNVLRPYFERLKVLKSIEGALEHSGYKISFLLRFAAFFPYSVLNYGLSVTSIKHTQYMFGFIGGWLWELVITYYGYCIGDVLNILSGEYKNDPRQTIFLLGSVIICILVSIWVLLVAYREVQRLSSNENEVPHVKMIEEIKVEQNQSNIGQTPSKINENKVISI